MYDLNLKRMVKEVVNHDAFPWYNGMVVKIAMSEDFEEKFSKRLASIYPEWFMVDSSSIGLDLTGRVGLQTVREREVESIDLENPCNIGVLLDFANEISNDVKVLTEDVAPGNEMAFVHLRLRSTARCLSVVRKGRSVGEALIRALHCVLIEKNWRVIYHWKVIYHKTG